MPWFDHPSYRPLRDALIARFQQKAIVFRSLKHIVFLCGAADSLARPNLLAFLQHWHPDTTLVFKADDIWAKIASTVGLNALEMEANLAELADAVIIIVESPGTFAELGAFSNSEPLRRKLLPILDISYRDDQSFINSGPVKWVDSDSLFRPSIAVDLSAVLVAAKEVTDRLGRLEPPSRQRIDNFLRHPKHLLFLIRDLVAVIGPVSAEHAGKYVRAIALDDNVPHVPSLLGLAESLGLVASVQVDGKTFYYVRPGERLRPFVRKKYFDLNQERAKIVAVLQTFPAARSPLQAIAETAKC